MPPPFKTNFRAIWFPNAPHSHKMKGCGTAVLAFDTESVRAKARQASTEDLLDRVTVYRAGMEPEAVDLIEMELRRRGLRPEVIAEHAAKRSDLVISHSDGTAVSCSFCERPA